jgi:hypothetical protein
MPSDTPADSSFYNSDAEYTPTSKNAATPSGTAYETAIYVNNENTYYIQSNIALVTSDSVIIPTDPVSYQAITSYGDAETYTSTFYIVSIASGFPPIPSVSAVLAARQQWPKF